MDYLNQLFQVILYLTPTVQITRGRCFLMIISRLKTTHLPIQVPTQINYLGTLSAY